MKTRLLTTLVLASVLLSGLSLAAETNDAASTTTPAADSAKPAKKKSLDKGMTGDEVIAMIGKPDKVAPMKTDQGQAEIWTYRRKVDTFTTQVATHTENITTFGGMPDDNSLSGMKSTPVLAYSMETTNVYQVTSLLMFDGKLVVAKQWREREKSLSH